MPARRGAPDVAAREHARARLEDMVDVVERFRRANRDGDGQLANRLNEHLDRLLTESPEHLLRTRELADWRFRRDGQSHGDALARDALAELKDAILALGPRPAMH